MKRSGDRILLWALALSLIAHGAAALVFRLPKVDAHPEQTPAPITVTILHSPPPATPTPPPPRVQPIVHPRTIAVRRPRVAPPVLRQPSDPGPPTDVPRAAPSAAPGPLDGPSTDGPSAPPAPTPTPKPACSVPFAQAKAVNVIPASAPDDAEQRTGEAKIEVTLTAAGEIAAVAIYRSSGDMMLDRAALRAARMSTYQPAIQNCSPVGGSYLFTVDFSG